MAQQVETKIEIGAEVIGQTHKNFFAICIAQSRRRAAAVIERGARPKAATMCAPRQAANGRVNLIEGRRCALASFNLFNREAAGDGAGLKSALRRVAQIT